MHITHHLFSFTSVCLFEVTVKPQAVLLAITEKDTDTNTMTTDHR